MRLDHHLPGVMTQSSGLDTPTTNFLPQPVVDVAKEVIRAFPHSKRVGNYLLGKTLGEGSFAKVKQALHTSTGEKVAIKVIDKKKAKEDVYVRKNLRREGKLLQMVRHRHVIQLLEIMETENSYYLVTELCQGGDLMDLICSNKRLDEVQTRKYIKQIISAIDYLHKAGILHRDLKVENLLLDHNKDIKIIDFGLSNSVRVSHTKDGGSLAQEYCVTQCGSPAYAAPELLGNKKYGPKVDIWSIGVNMYAMLTGNLPFTVEPFNIKTLHNKMLQGEMNAIPDTLTPECVDLLKKFLTASPDTRITLANAMQHPWITEGNNKPMEAAPFPNRLSSDNLDHNIIKHMSTNMEYRMSEVIRLCTNNIPNNATATYHMLLKKLTRHNETYKTPSKTKGKTSPDSRLSTPNNSKTFTRRSATGDVIRLTPVDKSHNPSSSTPRTPRRVISQDNANKTRKNDEGSTTTTPRNTKKKTESTEESTDGEKTLVRRRIQNARVLHQIHTQAPQANKKQTEMKKHSVLKAEPLPITNSNITELEDDDDDDTDDNAEQVDEDLEDYYEDAESGPLTARRPGKPILDAKSPRPKRKLNGGELHVQEIITTPLTPRSVQPSPETPTPRSLIVLPHIDTTKTRESNISPAGGKNSPQQHQITRVGENGGSSNGSPRLSHRKKYNTFGGGNKNRSSASSGGGGGSLGSSPTSLKQKTSTQNSSSQSTSSSRDGQKSTCSNPNSSMQPKHQFSSSTENKGLTISDPSTRVEMNVAHKTSVNVSSSSSRPVAKNINVVDIDQSFKRALPSVSPPRSLGQSNRRVVNIVYPPFNKTRSLTSQYTSPKNISSEIDSLNILNITGEKAGFNISPYGKSGLETIPLARIATEGNSKIGRSGSGAENISNDNSNKITLPVISPVLTKGNDATC